MKNNYLETIGLVERLHRLFLEVIKSELDNLKVEDINNVQALVLYNLGAEQISIGELTARGCYLGSNVSYNLKKMVANGYLEQVTSKHDRRSYTIKASPKGLDLCNEIDKALDRHVEALKEENINSFDDFVDTLHKFEDFWREISLQRTRFSIKKRS